MNPIRLIGTSGLLLSASVALGGEIRTYDFATRTPGVDAFAYAGAGSDQSPAAAGSPAAEISSYSDLVAEGEGFLQNQFSANNEFLHHRFVFHADEPYFEIGSIEVRWVGQTKNTNPGRIDGAAIFAWRIAGPGAGQWHLVAEGPDTEEMTTVVGIIPSSGQDFVSANGAINILIASKDRKTGQPKAGDMLSDFISITTAPPVLPPQLAGHWTLDDGSGGTAADLSGRDHHGDLRSMNSSQAWVTGRLAGALAFDGFNDRVEVPHHSDFDMQAGTVALWVLPADVAGTRGLVTKDSAGFDSGGQFGVVIEDDRVVARLESDSALYQVQSAPVLRADSWSHVAFTFGPSGMTLFVNGEPVDTNAYTGGGSNYEPLVFGADTDQSADTSTTGWTSPFFGAMDDIRVYNYAIEASDVAALWEMGAPPSIVRWQEVAP